MEDGTRGPKSAKEASAEALPQGVFAETIEHAVEAARFGVDTVLLVAGKHEDLRRVVEHVVTLATDAERLESIHAAVWKWRKGGGMLMVAGSIDAGRVAYRRLHRGMTDTEAMKALEIVSARRE